MNWLACIAVVMSLVVHFGIANLASAQGVLSAEERQLAVSSYNIGTDIGAMYLVEHTPRLRITLLLEECGSSELVAALREALPLPASFNFFYEKYENGTLPDEIVVVAAQITNAYVLGYQIGVRTEFQRMLEDQKQVQCSLAGAVAGQMLQ